MGNGNINKLCYLLNTHGMKIVVGGCLQVVIVANPGIRHDVDFLVRDILKTEYGDVNLDGRVDNTDFGFILGGFNRTGLGWKGGDVNGDGITNNADFGSVLGNFDFGV